MPRSLAFSTDGERRQLLQTIAAAATHAVGTEIDAIEAAVRQEIPEAKHIDLEVDASTPQQVAATISPAPLVKEA